MIRVGLIGAQGFVGSAFQRLLRDREGIKLTSVTLDNYFDELGREHDVLIDASGNSKKFLADKDPLKEFDLSVMQRIRTLINFPAKFHLHISSVDVYHDLTNHNATKENVLINYALQSRYGFHKLLAEELVQKYAQDWLIVRLAGMVGPGLIKNPIYDIINNKPLRIHPDSEYQFIHTDQVAQICWSLFEKQLRRIKVNVCADGLISPRDIAGILGIPINLLQLPADAVPRIVDINFDCLKQFTKVPQTIDVVSSFLDSIDKFPSEI